MYDSEGNPIANASVELDFEVPELPQIEISDSGILLVIDTEGANYSAEPSLWNTSFENPTNGEETIFQASMTVAEITGQEFDLFTMLVILTEMEYSTVMARMDQVWESCSNIKQLFGVLVQNMYHYRQMMNFILRHMSTQEVH